MSAPLMGRLQLNSPKKQSKKRESYIEWADYFMAMALLTAKRSKDPCTQVGACIVTDENKIVGLGYNGMPMGCDDDEYPWDKDTESPLDSKYMYVCHAETNAVLNKNVADVKGCTIYVALFPCNECAKIIIQSGIKRVVYMSDKHHDKDSTIASKRMLTSAKVQFSKYVPKVTKITIDFDAILNADSRENQ